jgi:hypothetical protein
MIKKIVDRFVNKIERISIVLKALFIIVPYNLFYKSIMNFTFPIRMKYHKYLKNYLSINSNEERKLEIKIDDLKLEEVIFACYFINQQNPQTGEQLNKADYGFIAPWYESVLQLGLDGIIIHDGLDDSFIKKYETKKIQFRKFKSGNNNVLDERWLFYYHFLLKTSIKRAFLTDISDVFITNNPFIKFNKKHVLYIGRDNGNKIRHSDWIIKELNHFFKLIGKKPPKSLIYQSFYNVGVVGGDREVLLYSLSKFSKYFLKADNPKYHEMTIFNLIVNRSFPTKLCFSLDESTFVNSKYDEAAIGKHVFSGYPLNSGFKDFDFNSKALFIHK